MATNHCLTDAEERTTAVSLWNLIQEALKPAGCLNNSRCSGWLPCGQEPVSPHPTGHHRDDRHFPSIQTCSRNGTGDCQAGKENAVTLSRDVRPDVSQRSLPPSAAERQRSRFTGGVHTPAPIMLKNINK